MDANFLSAHFSACTDSRQNRSILLVSGLDLICTSSISAELPQAWSNPTQIWPNSPPSSSDRPEVCRNHPTSSNPAQGHTLQTASRGGACAFLVSGSVFEYAYCCLCVSRLNLEVDISVSPRLLDVACSLVALWLFSRSAIPPGVSRGARSR